MVLDLSKEQKGILIIIGLVLLAGLYTQSPNPFATTEADLSETEDGCKYASFAKGYLMCDEYGSIVSTSSVGYHFEEGGLFTQDAIVSNKIHCDENTQRCTPVFKGAEGEWIFGELQWKTDSMDYWETFDDYPGGRAIRLPEIERGQSVRIKIVQGSWIEDLEDYSYSFYKEFQPYALKKYESIGAAGQDVVVNAESCRVYKGGSADYLTHGVEVIPDKYKDITYNEDKFRDPGILDFHKSIPFTIAMVETIDAGEEAGTVPVYDYEGGKVFCSAGSLYSVQKVESREGQCYQTPGEPIENVPCCPYQPNCNQDFEITEGPTEDKCVTTADCLGSGNYVTNLNDPTGRTVIQRKCINNTCETVDTKEVECTSNKMCINQTGDVCDMQTYECVNSTGPSGIPTLGELQEQSEQEGRYPVGQLSWIFLGFMSLIGFMIGKGSGKWGILTGLIVAAIFLLIGIFTWNYVSQLLIKGGVGLG